MDNKIHWEKWQTILVAASPVVGYALALVYEWGYNDFFKIPTELIKIDWTTIIVAVGASLSGLTLIVWLVIPILYKVPKQSVIILFAFTGFLFALRYLTVEESKQLAIMFAMILAAIIVVPWYFRNYGQNLAEKHRAISEPKKNDPIEQFVRKSKYNLLLIWVICIIFGFSALGGRSAALTKQLFYIPSTHPESIVLKMQGNNLICAKLYYLGKNNVGQEIGIISQEFFMLNMNEPNMSLKALKLAYVRVKE